MGGAVAARLVETGLVPLVHDVDEAAVARAVAAGAGASSSAPASPSRARSPRAPTGSATSNC